MASFNEAIDLAMTGAGGMDTGAPVSGFAAISVIYNSRNGATALLGVNATASSVRLPARFARVVTSGSHRCE
ncbi:hypothetical protein [Caballeronia sp. J97]|uniref:hypothetical protein n=1 Tax=Caballeronia sp. J97 TaxID=2805429 RepID=UPI002AB0B5C5|nr:hypothetical protein [Caballeronia sp. J97]